MILNELGFSTKYQTLFQTPASPYMEGIVDLHHTIMFFLVVISIFVLWLVFIVLYLYVNDDVLFTKGLSLKKFYHNLSKRNAVGYSLKSSTLSERIAAFLNVKHISLHKVFSFLNFCIDLNAFEKFKNRSISMRYNHGTLIEFFWTVLPCVILFLIAIPSYTLLYAIDDVKTVHYVVKVIGHQWYWVYEYTFAYDKIAVADYENYMSYKALTKDLPSDPSDRCFVFKKGIIKEINKTFYQELKLLVNNKTLDKFDVADALKVVTGKDFFSADYKYKFLKFTKTDFWNYRLSKAFPQADYCNLKAVLERISESDKQQLVESYKALSLVIPNLLEIVNIKYPSDLLTLKAFQSNAHVTKLFGFSESLYGRQLAHGVAKHRELLDFFRKLCLITPSKTYENVPVESAFNFNRQLIVDTEIAKAFLKLLEERTAKSAIFDFLIEGGRDCYIKNLLKSPNFLHVNSLNSEVNQAKSWLYVWYEELPYLFGSQKAYDLAFEGFVKMQSEFVTERGIFPIILFWAGGVDVMKFMQTARLLYDLQLCNEILNEPMVSDEYCNTLHIMEDFLKTKGGEYYPYKYLIKNVEITSYMVPEDELKQGDLRLLEVDNVLYVPVHVHIHFYITSADVLHSWAIPSLGLKVDAVPGRLNEVSVYISRPGVYYGQCSEICGVNHAFMPITLVAYESKKEFLDL